MLMLREEIHQVARDSEIFTNKLKNMKLHLSELLNKKLRLEVEIKNLKKSIENKQKEYEKTLKVKLSLESQQFVTDNPELKKTVLEDLLVQHSLLQIDVVLKEIQELFNENFPEEVK